MCVYVGGGAVVNVFLFSIPFDLGGVCGFVVFAVYAFEQYVPHVSVVLELPLFAKGGGAVGALVGGGVKSVNIYTNGKFGSKVFEF